MLYCRKVCKAFMHAADLAPRDVPLTISWLMSCRITRATLQPEN